MYKELLVRFPMIDLVLVGQLLFFAIFLAALVWVFRKGSNDFYDRLARMPYDDTEVSDERN